MDGHEHEEGGGITPASQNQLVEPGYECNLRPEMTPEETARKGIDAFPAASSPFGREAGPSPDAH
jgi:hypothetical protein